ncbi:hypothetical protein SDC9_113687 [bioreactor metagenome]|uniref:DUF1648 domain-containing protein n=1 Tax=bioreactor metagenome TaxID=1076179 RepID=A0A645BN37_9ZZZZ|nr:hypothetical protein [Oscillospiraceae bacterium]
MRTQKNKIFVLIATISAAVIFSVIGYILLPKTLTMQITLNGENGTTLPKVAGLAIPLGITSLLSYLYYKYDNIKNLVGSLIGILVFILIFIFNL